MVEMVIFTLCVFYCGKGDKAGGKIMCTEMNVHPHVTLE